METKVSDVRQELPDDSNRTRKGERATSAPDRLLDVHEAAAMLGLRPGTLYQWAYERRIPVVKLSGSRGPLRFRLTTLLKIIEDSERPALRSASAAGGQGRLRGR